MCDSLILWGGIMKNYIPFKNEAFALSEYSFCVDKFFFHYDQGRIEICSASQSKIIKSDKKKQRFCILSSYGEEL
jgi:hypothetical protein